MTGKMVISPDMNNHRKKVLLLVLFIALAVLVRFSPLGTALTFENLKQHRDALLVFVNDHYWLSVACYIGVYIAAVSFTLPVALIMTLAGGFLFGTAPAVLYINIGATTGATISFLSARYLLGSGLQETYALVLRRFNDEIERNGTHYLLTMRFIPVFPFFLINFLAGLTRIPLRTFVWTTSVGILPTSVIFAFTGRQLGTITSPSDILSRKMLLTLAALALIALVPIVRKHLKGPRKERDQ
jgi:uncharacterized membrane protein YdjX (TVP38/TMEM64 family)